MSSFWGDFSNRNTLRAGSHNSVQCDFQAIHLNGLKTQWIKPKVVHALLFKNTLHEIAWHHSTVFSNLHLECC